MKNYIGTHTLVVGILSGGEINIDDNVEIIDIAERAGEVAIKLRFNNARHPATTMGDLVIQGDIVERWFDTKQVQIYRATEKEKALPA